jgi:hypothetical protein
MKKGETISFNEFFFEIMTLSGESSNFFGEDIMAILNHLKDGILIITK